MLLMNKLKCYCIFIIFFIIFLYSCNSVNNNTILENNRLQNYFKSFNYKPNPAKKNIKLKIIIIRNMPLKNVFDFSQKFGDLLSKRQLKIANPNTYNFSVIAADFVSSYNKFVIKNNKEVDNFIIEINDDISVSIKKKLINYKIEEKHNMEFVLKEKKSNEELKKFNAVIKLNYTKSDKSNDDVFKCLEEISEIKNIKTISFKEE